jgi:hypothetical protein
MSERYYLFLSVSSVKGKRAACLCPAGTAQFFFADRGADLIE